MALSSDTTWRDYTVKDVKRYAQIAALVKSGSKLYNGSLCSFDSTVGEIKPYDGTVTDRLIGWHFDENVTGNGSGARNLGRIKIGGFLVSIPVTGLSSTPSDDYGKPVYASDDGTYTLTGSTSTMKVGHVAPQNKGVTAGTNAWVLMRDVFGIVGGE